MESPFHPVRRGPWMRRMPNFGDLHMSDVSRFDRRLFSRRICRLETLVFRASIGKLGRASAADDLPFVLGPQFFPNAGLNPLERWAIAVRGLPSTLQINSKW